MTLFLTNDHVSRFKLLFTKQSFSTLLPVYKSDKYLVQLLLDCTSLAQDSIAVINEYAADRTLLQIQYEAKYGLLCSCKQFRIGVSSSFDKITLYHIQRCIAHGPFHIVGNRYVDLFDMNPSIKYPLDNVLQLSIGKRYVFNNGQITIKNRERYNEILYMIRLVYNMFIYCSK